MSALGHKQTYAVQNVMSALPSIATAKADSRKRSRLLHPRKRTCAVHQPMSAGPIADIRNAEEMSARQRSASLDLVKTSLPQADVLDRGRQRLGFVLFAVCRDLCGIALKAVVVKDVAVSGRVVIAAHPKADKIPLLWTVSEPATASDLIHIYADLSYRWLRSGYKQSCR